MTDWNEQAAPNNNLGSTAFKKALTNGPKSSEAPRKEQKKKHGR